MSILNTYTYTYTDVDGPCTLPWSASPKPYTHTTLKTTSMNEKNIIYIKLSIEVAKLQWPCQLYLESVQILEAHMLGMSKVLNHFLL